MSFSKGLKGGRSGRGSGRAALLVMAVAAALAVVGCSAVGREKLSRPEAPENYQRRIMLVVERPDFRPVGGAEITIETEAPTRLVAPAGGRGRTDGQGALELVFEPVPHYDRSAWAGGDIIVEYPVRAKLIIRRQGRAAAEVILDDKESFARYADPLYQGLNRDPEPGLTYYAIEYGALP
ncbi:hypothetical protein C4J81_10835 [Deltaproteobacteria bacterium Smac51]|nr:hypothetical protein C4J81_10835 [Deltaproteobacteria bacterium Smac51]